MNRKKKQQYVAAATLLIAGLLLFGKMIWDHQSQLPPELKNENNEKNIENTSGPTEKEVSHSNQKTLEDFLFGNTYEYIDEYRSGHPVTYTFYSDGQLLVYYWESDENEDVPIGSAAAVYTINDEITEIIITWADDGSTEVKPFNLERNKITIGDSEFKKSNKKIYNN